MKALILWNLSASMEKIYEKIAARVGMDEHLGMSHGKGLYKFERTGIRSLRTEKKCCDNL